MGEQSPIVIVTGAAGNLGRAVAQRLASRGTAVVTVDRHPLPAGNSAASGPQPAEALAGVDLLDSRACAGVVERTLGRFGRIDGLVHTVGGFASAPAAESGPDLFETMFRLNLLTTVNIVQACLPPMRAVRRGSIVVISAGVALKAPVGMAAYAAAKSGMLRLVESFADELKAEGVRINAVLPSIIDTPQNRASMPKANHSAWVAPEELAATIDFLVGAGASAVTGAAISVPGRV
jgi:NAD(P)-dependent dehydrogenase (short-subunit alcohol dehydrogenase family)